MKNHFLKQRPGALAVELDDSNLLRLIQDPKESLSVELKQWIDPSSPAGVAKIARACFALRNNNGGHLIVGFTKNGSPDRTNIPHNVRATFHFDTIQAIVSHYASRAFEVVVQFATRDGQEYPIISVPSGVKTPVAAARDLSGDGGKLLIRCHAIYVRTLDSNNTASTSEVPHQDLDRLVESCFDNRDAKIAEFARKHLAGLNVGLLGDLADTATPARTAEHESREFLTIGFDRFRQESKTDIENLGTIEGSVVLSGGVPITALSRDLLASMDAQKPRHSGWSHWIMRFSDDERTPSPYLYEGGWECLCESLSSHPIMGGHIDFWRIEPDGKFYHLRVLEEDMNRAGLSPGDVLSFRTQVSRVAEMASEVMSFARTMGCDPESTELHCSFRWKKMRGRRLASLSGNGIDSILSGKARQDEVTTSISIPLQIPRSGLPPYIESAVSPLFQVFGGDTISSEVMAELAAQTILKRY